MIEIKLKPDLPSMADDLVTLLPYNQEHAYPLDIGKQLLSYARNRISKAHEGSPFYGKKFHGYKQAGQYIIKNITEL